MKPPHESHQNPDSSSSDPLGQQQSSEDLDFEQELEAVERSLDSLKERYAQVQATLQQQSQLQQRREYVEQELQQHPLPSLKAELQQIQEQLDELELNLESRLFSWGSLKEVFWQIIRFGGLGVVLGWSLAFMFLNAPKKPAPAPSSKQSSLEFLDRRATNELSRTRQ